MMECPDCGSEMEEQYKRIKVEHPFATAKGTFSRRTAMKRVWYCGNCDKHFAATLKLSPVTIAVLKRER